MESATISMPPSTNLSSILLSTFYKSQHFEVQKYRALAYICLDVDGIFDIDNRSCTGDLSSEIA